MGGWIWEHISKKNLSSQFRFGQSFFATATKSHWVSGMSDCLQILRYISLSYQVKNSMISIFTASWTSFPICVLWGLKRQKNVSSDSLDIFLAFIQYSYSVYTRLVRSWKSLSQKSLKAAKSLNESCSIR